MGYFLCILTTESQWENPESSQGESSASVPPVQPEVSIRFHFVHFLPIKFILNEVLCSIGPVNMHLYVCL